MRQYEVIHIIHYLFGTSFHPNEFEVNAEHLIEQNWCTIIAFDLYLFSSIQEKRRTNSQVIGKLRIWFEPLVDSKIEVQISSKYKKPSQATLLSS